MILAHEVLGRLAPFFRFIVASVATGVPLPERGEIDPLGWWLMWRIESERLTIRTALPKGISRIERQEVLIGASALPAVLGASVSEEPKCLTFSMGLETTAMKDLEGWLERWKLEVEAAGW